MFGAYGLAFWYGTELFLSSELEPGDILVVSLINLSLSKEILESVFQWHLKIVGKR
jgi:hypothetical protein